MALDLTGITNQGDFYSPHYLEELLENDLRGLLKRWREAEEEFGRKPPYRKLEGCAKEFFRCKSQAAAAAPGLDRWQASRPAHIALVEALGYEHAIGAVRWLDDGSAVPLLFEEKRDGRPYLWAIETRFVGEDELPLELRLLAEQLPQHDGTRPKLPEGTLEDLPGAIFSRAEPPRWVMLLADGTVHLIERTKWAQGKCLIFDFDELLGRKEAKALQVVAALLARDALCPDDGTILHDTLDENSHKHAFGVSEDLKYGVRRAVELLANEYVWYQRNVRKQSLFGDDQLAQKLKAESLRYLYRLLFLLYAEARGDEVGVVPMKSEEYRLGYSFEALRDLEQVPLTSDAARDGYFLHTSLERLFTLVDDGHGYVPGVREEQIGLHVAEAPAPDEILERGFTIPPLHSSLFDPARTPLLSSVKFRNHVLQDVIRQLSLSREKSGNHQRGRISYAQLGINQLGAVYEGLLAYSGFFAREDLFEVKPAGSRPDDEKAQSYFIPESAVQDYRDDEFVVEEVAEGQYRRKRYDKGAFVFRLAGRDRQQSASYYTPEVLTRCVVKYSLKELLKEKTADDILDLTICEPAMGSGAFLNETIGQLSDAYLERKQIELARIIPPAEYPRERKRVMAHLALNNCYGVDLNPVAAELAEVSLWLTIIQPDLPAPWLGLRLAVGNSLIGARRQVFKAEDLTGGGKKKPTAADIWLTRVPESVALAAERPAGSVYHFLVGDAGIAAYEKDKVIKGLAPEAIERIKKWRKAFNAPYSVDEVRRLEMISEHIDGVWQRAVEDRRRTCAAARFVRPLFGRDVPSLTPTRAKREHAYLLRPTGPMRRLQAIMDAWCALWFWPIREAAKLPSRDEWLRTIELLAVGKRGPEKAQLPFDFMRELGEEQRQLGLAFIEEHGLVNVDEVGGQVPWLAVAQAVAAKRRFHHWELAFAEVFADRDGFDLILGNPPWVNHEWNEAGMLADFDPRIDLRGESAPAVAARRQTILNSEERIHGFLDAFETFAAAHECFSSIQTYPLLAGVRTNVYKCFLTRAWAVSGPAGTVGFLHPAGIYDDPKGGELRAAAYPRLRSHFRFVNELKLFEAIGNLTFYSVNVFGRPHGHRTDFDNISNLFHPLTIDASYAHDGQGAVPGIKNPDDDFDWDLRGHRQRIVRVDGDALALFAKLYDEPGTPALEARLPVVHSREILNVLHNFALQKRRLADLEYFSTQHWNETGAQSDGTIRRQTRFPEGPEEWILSGPHFFVATPIYQTPNEGCSSHRDYTGIDLTDIPDDFLPRTNYVPACSPAEYLRRTPKWKGRPVTEYFRHVNRTMVGPNGERTLIPAIIPPGVAHIDLAFSITFDSHRHLVWCSGLLSSLAWDFLVKTTGKGHVRDDVASQLPVPPEEALLESCLAVRVLRLNCITALYKDLWEKSWRGEWAKDRLSTIDPRLSDWSELGAEWNRRCALRRDVERRYAVIELDVIAALTLGLTLDELLTIYRVQFPVLQKYEHESRYDQAGRLVPAEVLKIARQEGLDINQPGPGIRWTDKKLYPLMEREYAPPFTRHDREADMAEAYGEFERRIGTAKVA
jgi:hypothetical protein